MAQVHRSRTVRAIYLILGVFFLALGVIGTVLPLVPTTFPILLAGFFFARSSERFDSWLSNHRVFGPLIRDWRAGLGFTARAKVIAVAAITATFGFSVGWVVEPTAVRVGLVIFAIGLCAYILRLPTKQSERV